MDVVARSGGEEFAIVLPETDQHRAFLFAEELLDPVRSENVRAPELEITASIGVATFPEHSEDLAGLMAAADRALHAAKALGRDRAVIYSPEVTNVLGAVSGRRSVETQAHLATVLSLAEALDQRDTGTARHSQTVGRLCEMMAMELGLERGPHPAAPARRHPPRHRQDRRPRLDPPQARPADQRGGGPDAPPPRAGRPHPLQPRARRRPRLDPGPPRAAGRHRLPEGPDRGDEIPLEASILAVADAYEAMTSDRVYRLSIGRGQGRARSCRSTRASSSTNAVVEALLTALDREGQPVVPEL